MFTTRNMEKIVKDETGDMSKGHLKIGSLNFIVRVFWSH